MYRKSDETAEAQRFWRETQRDSWLLWLCAPRRPLRLCGKILTSGTYSEVLDVLDHEGGGVVEVEDVGEGEEEVALLHVVEAVEAAEAQFL